MIHPAAIVEPGARLGVGCEIMAGAVIFRHCVLGDRVTVWPHAVLGGDPQDLRFDRATESGVRIGAGTVIREAVTVHRSTKPGGETVVGDNCFLMASSHVAHDCIVGDHVVVANAALLAGHVRIGDHCFLGGGAVLHQYVRVGDGAMLGGLAGVGYDVPPYLMVANRNEVIGLNLVGLKRRGVAREAVVELKELFHAVYGQPGNIRALAAARLPAARTPEARRFLEFFAEGKRGFMRTRRGGQETAE
jgi:UDP-N-acetylglucosamine acyltransferase